MSDTKNTTEFDILAESEQNIKIPLKFCDTGRDSRG